MPMVQSTADLTDEQRQKMELDRLVKSSLGEYDMVRITTSSRHVVAREGDCLILKPCQITVVSQKAINQQLSALWDKEKLKADRLSKMIEQRKAKGEKPPFTDIKWPGLVRWESRTTASLPP